MAGVNGLLWTTVISGLATGWLAVVFAVANWNDDSSAAAFSLIAGIAALILLAHPMSAQGPAQIEASFREAEMRVSEEEAQMATFYVIRYLTLALRRRPDEVADFCVESGLPLSWDDFLNIARGFQQENEGASN